MSEIYFSNVTLEEDTEYFFYIGELKNYGLLNRQEQIFLYMYESMPEMTLDEIPGVTILGPDKEVAKKLNSKIYQYRNLEKRIPIVDYAVSEGLVNVVLTSNALREEWDKGIFVTNEYSAAGVNSLITHSAEDITGKFRCEGDTYLMSRYVPHLHDPTVLAVVAAEDDVYIAGVADQRIEEGTKFTGSVYPSVPDEGTKEKLKEYTVEAGKWLAEEGYRGIFGCDYIVDETGELRAPLLPLQLQLQEPPSHFRVPVEKGRDIIESMYGNISGDAIPRYIATAGGKIPLHRSNVKEKRGNDLVLRKPWSGEEVNYPDADPGIYNNEHFSFTK